MVASQLRVGGEWLEAAGARFRFLRSGKRLLEGTGPVEGSCMRRPRRASMRRTLAITGVAALVAAVAALTASAAPGTTTFPEVIALPSGWLPEGIAVGRGSTLLLRLAGGRGDLSRRSEDRRGQHLRAWSAGEGRGRPQGRSAWQVSVRRGRADGAGVRLRRGLGRSRRQLRVDRTRHVRQRRDRDPRRGVLHGLGQARSVPVASRSGWPR